LFLWLNE
jgi:upstream activation factor subunit UAF30